MCPISSRPTLQMCRSGHSFLAILFTILSCVVSRSDASEGATSYKIEIVTARLYLNREGTFSESILSKAEYSDGALWNTIIGGGVVGSPASELLVEAKIVYAGAEVSGKYDVVIDAQDGRSLKQQKVTRVPASVRSVFFAGTWLANVGCNPIKLKVTLRRNGRAIDGPKSWEIPFRCGE